MYHHLDNGEVEFSTPEIIPNQHTTINNKSQVTVTPISLGEITLRRCGGCPNKYYQNPIKFLKGRGYFAPSLNTMKVISQQPAQMTTSRNTQQRHPGINYPQHHLLHNSPNG